MDVYQLVTDKIVGMLDTGVVPWRRPWSDVGPPHNLITRKPYRGINYFLLSTTKYVSPFWLTMKQANQLGGGIRKGEESTVVVFWKIDENPEQEATEKDDKIKRRFMLRYYRVFNLEQCDLSARVLDRLPKTEMREHEPIDVAELLVANMPQRPQIQTARSKAFYNPISDRVTMPPAVLFASGEEYYATLLHELAHSTGHSTRLGRETITEAASFGSAIYSKEELVAEMGAAYLCGEVGISAPAIENQAAYVAGWLSKLRDDRRLLIHAAAQGQRAADFILRRTTRASENGSGVEVSGPTQPHVQTTE